MQWLTINLQEQLIDIMEDGNLLAEFQTKMFAELGDKIEKWVTWFSKSIIHYCLGLCFVEEYFLQVWEPLKSSIKVHDLESDLQMLYQKMLN